MEVSLISICTDSGELLAVRPLSSYLEKKGHRVNIISLSERSYIAPFKPISNDILRQVADLVKQSNLVGVSCMSLFSKRTVQVIEYLKKSNVSKIIWGGIEASLSPEKCLQYADIVCVGEGEEAICELVEAMEQKKNITNIQNLWFKNGGGIIKNPIRPLIQSVDRISFTGNVNSYELNNGTLCLKPNTQEELVLQTVRGCPHHCSYCCNAHLRKIYHKKGKVIRKQSMGNVIEELVYYKTKMPYLKHIFFADDDFFVRTEAELKFFAVEYKNKIGIPFQVYGSPSSIKPEKLAILIEAGLQQIVVGIQTGSENVNKRIYNRNISNVRTMKAIRIINDFTDKMADPPYYQVINQNPYETKDDLLQTINFLASFPPPLRFVVFPLRFFRGLELFEKLKEDKILDDEYEPDDYWAKNSIIDMPAYVSEVYLNQLIGCMNGWANKNRIGDIPRLLLPLLKSQIIISFFNKTGNFPVFVAVIWKWYRYLRNLNAKIRGLCTTKFKKKLSLQT